MNGDEVPPRSGRLEWQVARVAEARDETQRTRTIVLDVPDWPGHRPGQHVDVRLVAEDGYEAQRSYSIASAPERAIVELTVEQIENAEVSPYLCDVLRIGDGLEIRGPIGGYFVWDDEPHVPVLLVAGGSGVVPLMSMLRHRARGDPASWSETPVRLIYSSRMAEDVIYRGELEQLAGAMVVDLVVTLTREPNSEWTGRRSRIDSRMLMELAWPADRNPRAFVCGPTSLVESVANSLVELGYDPARVKTERFGPTG